ncbi:DUF1194 domain-containing protein [Roseobacter sinensis]|uniref:DUF1194 domain-containing protein n=1 Tax=Roseobacter sinensis TaxID=2931391 RepID=A0ABT3BJH5_9RHOB|nr:DUF1194 domain-containing protein [Roseobacter sp. WL0113]MCV3273730.1 DUF1194 domain-containing protein [Roseobacter sp. WL0113]
MSLMLIGLITLLPADSGAQDRLTPRYASGQVNIHNPNRVDVALVLAVDVSSSVKSHERRFQREAYAAALQDPRVAGLALGGGAGRVAIAYMEWSGRHYQRLHLPIRVMSTPEELARFAADILAIEDRSADPMYVQPTAIGNALLAAERAMAALEVPARDYVIDISGDGVLNDGTGILAVRQQLLAMGLTVNGLPIEVTYGEPNIDQLSFDRVSRYYEDCVIGGPGAFHLVARGFSDVRETLIMKLMLEMAQMRPEEKSRIALAWNRSDAPLEAQILPATMLQLAPNGAAKPQRQPTDCGETRVSSSNPFQIIP